MIAESDVHGKVLYDDGEHKFIWLGADTERKKGVVQTNQYLIIDRGRGVLLDPGGVHLFSRVVAVASRFIDLSNIEAIFFSHQDPDVSSGIALWLGVTNAVIYISDLWIRFLPHFGIVDEKRIRGIEAAGRTIKLASGSALRCVPSHFLHSAGCYCLYDERARTLFSGDIGTAVFPDGEQTLFVEDFEQHVKLMKGFHERYMSGNAVLRRWIEKVSALEIEMITPQHGAVFGKEASKEFLAWLRDLKCGADLAEALYS